MKEDKKKMTEKVFLILSVIITICIFYFSNFRIFDKFKDKPNCFTKMISWTFSKDADGMVVVDYKINVNMKIYEGHFWLQGRNKSLIKDSMTVKYICNEPDINELIIDN